MLCELQHISITLKYIYLVCHFHYSQCILLFYWTHHYIRHLYSHASWAMGNCIPEHVPGYRRTCMNCLKEATDEEQNSSQCSILLHMQCPYIAAMAYSRNWWWGSFYTKLPPNSIYWYIGHLCHVCSKRTSLGTMIPTQLLLQRVSLAP